MPPPKKPKKGPTTAEQFLTADEKHLDDAGDENSSCTSPSDSDQSNSSMATVDEDRDSHYSLPGGSSKNITQDTPEASSVLRQLFATSSPTDNVKISQNNGLPMNHWVCTERCMPLTESQCTTGYQQYLYQRSSSLFSSKQSTHLENVSKTDLNYALESNTVNHSLGLSVVQTDQPSTSNMAYATSSPKMTNSLQEKEPFNLTTKSNSNASGEHRLPYSSCPSKASTVSDFHKEHAMNSIIKSHDDKTSFLNNRPHVANILQYTETDRNTHGTDRSPKVMHYKNNPQQYDGNLNGR